MIQIGGKVPLAASGDSFAVATPHSAATAAAVASFHAGGNAVDAALAASVVLAVVYPHMCGPGGDLFAVLADGHTQAVVNGSGAAAAGVDAERIRRHHPTMPEFGALSVTVPGTVAAWVELAQRYGRLPLAAAIAPGVEHASRGIAVSMSLARAIVAHKARIERDSALRQTFAPGGHPLVVGDLLKLPALAATLRSVADEGRSRGLRANAVAPISIRTGDNLRAMGSTTRYVEREAVADAVVFLCSRAARSITGQVLRLTD